MGWLSDHAGTVLGGALGYAAYAANPALGAAIGASLGGGIDASRAAGKAADAQVNAANEANALQYKMWQEQQALQKPWLDAGQQALNKLVPLASNYTPFGMSQFQADPGYAFRMAEGMKALERSAAARGGLLSGATLKGIQRYGQDLASQEYTNAFNRYQAERAARLGPLQSLAGVGQTATQQLSGQAGQYGANVADTMQSAGAARASGYVGGSNALNQAIGNAGNLWMQHEMMNKMGMMGGTGPAPSAPFPFGYGGGG